LGLLAATCILWAMGGTQHERPVLTATASQSVAALEAKAQMRPSDPEATRGLAQAYLDARQPGMAIVLIESSTAQVQKSPRVQHAYARALVDAGRSDEALAVEQRVVATCSSLAEEQKALAAGAAGCDPVLLASAMRRADILRELVSLGVEDAEAHPEASLVAYQNATREARVAVE
jgi:predicted Zn-dependent protease